MRNKNFNLSILTNKDQIDVAIHDLTELTNSKCKKPTLRSPAASNQAYLQLFRAK